MMKTNVAYSLDDSAIGFLKFVASKGWLERCCSDGYSFSLSKNECILTDEKESSWMKQFSKLFNFIRYALLPSTPFRFGKIPVHSYLPNGTLCFQNSTCFQRGQYCFDYVPEQNEFMFLTGTNLKEEFSWMKLLGEGLKHFLFFFSLLLALFTLVLYLFLPALRRRVYDKCIICYLISLTTMVVTIYNFMVLKIIDNIHKMVYCDALRMFLILSVTFWLNVICFHLWRSVRSMKAKRRIRLLYYAIYAWGCPLMVIGVDIIRHHYNSQILNELTEKWYALDRMASLIVLFINLCLFLHVALIIWQQNNQWEGNSECKKHIKKQQVRMWLILKLFLIMGILEWNNFFSCAYKLGVDYDIYVYITNFLYLCPGYVIFIVFFYCNEKVTSELKKKFTSSRSSIAHSNKFAAKIMEHHQDQGCKVKKVNSQLCLLESGWVFHISE